MKTQSEVYDHKKNRNKHHFTNQPTNQISKRSKVMKHQAMVTRSLRALVAIVLISSLALAQGNVTNTGPWTNTGTLKVTNFTNSGASAAFTNGGSAQLWIKGTLTTNAGGTPADPQNFNVKAGQVRYYKANTQTVNHLVKDNTYADLYLTGSADAKTLSGSITASGTVTADAASLAISTYTLTLTRTASTPLAVLASGTFSFGSGVVDYAGGAAQDVYGTTYGTLTLSTNFAKNMVGDVTASTALNINANTLSIAAHTLTVGAAISDNSGAGTITGSTSSNLVINGAGNVTLPVITGSNLGALTYNRGTDIVNMASNITVNGALTATAGTLHVKTFQLELLSTVTGTSGGFASDLAGTVYYNAPGAGQAVFAASYGNLTFNGQNKDLSAAATVSVAGTFVPGGASGHTVTGNTFVFNGAGQGIPTFNGANGYNNLTTAGGAVTKTLGGNVKVAGAFVNGNDVTTDVSTHILTILGAKSQGNDAATMQFAGATNGLIFTTGTVEYNLNGAQTITADATPASNYYKILKLSSGGTKTVDGASLSLVVRTTGNLTVNSSVTLATTSDGDLRVEGDLNNNGSVTNLGSITVGL